MQQPVPYPALETLKNPSLLPDRKVQVRPSSSRVRVTVTDALFASAYSSGLSVTLQAVRPSISSSGKFPEAGQETKSYAQPLPLLSMTFSAA